MFVFLFFFGLFVFLCVFFGLFVFPQTGLPVGFYLRKKRLDTLVGGLCCVGRGFGRAGRAGPGWADLALLGALGWVGRGIWPLDALGWVGRGVWLWWARWAGLGADLAFCV